MCVELNALLDAARSRPGPEGKRLVCLLEIAYATGLRVSELVSLPVAKLPVMSLPIVSLAVVSLPVVSRRVKYRTETSMN